MTRDPDIVVIGAGPAGCLAATLLVREGLRVLLVERRRFPRPKVCGGCLSAHALASLDRAGLGPSVRALGAAPVDALRLYQRGRLAVVPLPPGLAVSRRTLDESLAAAAVASGCDLLAETTGILLPDNEDSGAEAPRRVSLRRADGRTTTARARVVIVADGLGHSSLLECPSFQTTAPATSRVGIGGEAAPGAVEVEPGSITMAVSARGYVGAVSVERGRVNVAAAVDPALLRTAGGPAAAVRVVLEDAGVRVFAPLESVHWMGTLPLTQRLAPVAARGVFVLGDAAGYVEPFTGEGMAWAFAGAQAVVPFARRALAAPGPSIEREWAVAYARAVGREQRWCRAIARCLRRPLLVSAFVELLGRRPGLAAPVLAHLAVRRPPARERTA